VREERRLLLWKRISLMQERLPRDSGAGLTKNTRHASSAIFPWIVGDEQSVIDLASALQKEGFLVPAIRYPTVAKGSARLHDRNGSTRRRTNSIALPGNQTAKRLNL
jgi:7-keto-8-aminopelargonate synthetase-like enzyme